VMGISSELCAFNVTLARLVGRSLLT